MTFNIFDEVEEEFNQTKKKSSIPKVASGNIFDEVEMEFQSQEKEPGLVSEVGRHTGRSAARIAETALGMPGDILQAVTGLGKGGYGYLKDALFGETPEPEEVMDVEAAPVEEESPKRVFGLFKNEKPSLAENIAGLFGKEEAQERLKGFREKGLEGTVLPTSEDFRNITKAITGDYLDPRGEGEEFADEVVSDVTALAVPLGGEFKLLKPALVGLGANIAKEGAKALGVGEKGQFYTKMGTMFLGTMLRKPGTVNKIPQELYKKSKALLPKEAEVSAKGLSNQLSNLKTQLKKGGSAPYKQAALTKIDEIKKVIKNGNIRVDELTEFKKSINDIGQSKKIWEEGLTIGKKSKGVLKRVAGVVDDGIEQYGKQNPKFLDVYRKANESYAAIAQGNDSLRFIKSKLVQHKSVAGVAGGYALLGAMFNPGAAATAAAGAAGTLGALYAGYKPYQIASRMMKSPELRKYYFGILNSAIKEDSAAFSRNFNKLDDELKKKKSMDLFKK